MDFGVPGPDGTCHQDEASQPPPVRHDLVDMWPDFYSYLRSNEADPQAYYHTNYGSVNDASFQSDYDWMQQFTAQSIEDPSLDPGSSWPILEANYPPEEGPDEIGFTNSHFHHYPGLTDDPPAYLAPQPVATAVADQEQQQAEFAFFLPAAPITEPAEGHIALPAPYATPLLAEAPVQVPIAFLPEAVVHAPIGSQVEAPVDGLADAPRPDAILAMPGRTRALRSTALQAAMAAVAPMAPTRKSTDIPLLCGVCPKTPKFSDVSHLLTHFNSKGHLHSLQQVKLRALSDISASTQLADFTNWYNQYNIDGLLADRLAAKEQKEAGKKKRGRPAVSVHKGFQNLGLQNINHQRRNVDDDALPLQPNVGPGSLFHSHQLRRDAPDDDPLFQTPRRARVSGHYGEIQGDSDVSHDIELRSLSEASDSLQSDPSLAVDECLDQSKLKGVVLPGMGLFDAATPQTRRKRNQRKDGTILEQMKTSSASVLPNESVWNADFQFERERDIYASPSIEGSPVPQRETRKRRTKRSMGLSQNSANSPVKKHAKPTTKSRPVRRVANSRARDAANGITKTEGDDTPEIGRSESSRPSSRLSFDVFRDDNNSGRMTPSGLISDNRFEFRTRLPLQSLSTNMASNSNLASPTPMAKPSSFNLFGAKEINHLTFQDPAMNGDYFDGSGNGSTAGSLNPLLQPRSFAMHDFNLSSYANDILPRNGGFQPANTPYSYGRFHSSSLDEYQSMEPAYHDDV